MVAPHLLHLNIPAETRIGTGVEALAVDVRLDRAVVPLRRNVRCR
jgi:hypothetical protein